MMPIDSPVDILNFQRALRDSLSAIVTDVPAAQWVWANANAPAPPRPTVVLDLISGPFSMSTERRYRQAVDSAVLTVNSVTAGEQYLARINGYQAGYTALAGDGVTEVRDGLLADFGTIPRLALATSGADAISVIPTVAGALMGGVVALGDATWTPTLNATDLVEDLLSQETMLVQVDVIVSGSAAGGGMRLVGGAMQIARTIQQAIKTVEGREALRRRRIVAYCWRPPISASGVAPDGAEREQRAVFEIEVRAPGHTPQIIPNIETIEGGVDVGSGVVPITTA